MRSNLIQELLTRYKNIGDDPDREQIAEIIMLMENYLTDLEAQSARLNSSDPEAQDRLIKFKRDLAVLREIVGTEPPRFN